MADAGTVSELKLRVRSKHERVLRRKAVVLDYSPWDVVTLDLDGPSERAAEDLVPDRPQVSVLPVRRVG